MSAEGISKPSARPDTSPAPKSTSSWMILYWTVFALLMGAGLALWVFPSGANENLGMAFEPQPEALIRLRQVAQAYQSLPAYEDHGSFTFSITVNGKPQEESSPLKLAFERPRKLVIKTGEVKLVSDGSTVTTLQTATRKYLEQKAPEDFSLAWLLSGPAGAVLQGGPTSLPNVLVLDLLMEPEPLSQMTQQAVSLTLQEPRVKDGRKLDVLRMTFQASPPLLLFVDPETNLLRRIEIVMSDQALQERAPSDTTLSNASAAWDSGAIEIKKPPEPETFVFHAPEGYDRVTPAEMMRDSGPQSPLLGKPAPEFSMTVLGKNNRTRVLSKADLAGKVVLLDFWATWCGPCREELPELQKLTETLAKQHPEKVAVIALSQDRTPDEGSLRDLVEVSLKGMKVNLAEPVGLVGLDPDQAVGEAFAVTGLPTIVLLDADGVVQRVQVGYGEGLMETLEGDIATLLSGQPLLKPEQAEPEAEPK